MSTTPPPLRERDGKLTEGWYIACLSRELDRRRPLARRIYDTGLVLFRDENGSARCLPDRCLHRHARLSKGVCLNGKIGCPYHGWVYDGLGQVVAVPSEGPEGGCEARNLRLPPFPVKEQDGCIWVWMGTSPPASEPFRFPSQAKPGWISYFMITDFENEVTHLAENFMDVPHTVFVHAGWFRSASKKRVPISVQTDRGSVLVTYNQPQDSIGFTGRILNPKNSPMLHTDRFISPNLTRVDYTFEAETGFVITSQISPISTLQSRVYTEICYRLAGPRMFSRLARSFFGFYTRQVIEQDVRIMKIQGDNLREDMTCRFHATDADAVHSAIERLREYARLGDPRLLTHSDLQEKVIWI